MFINKPTQIGNGTRSLLWIANDSGCYDYIIHDWRAYFHLIAKWVVETKVVVQAGGNCGLYPLYYAEMFDRVFTFEPDPMNFHCLAANCTNSKIIKFNTGLADTPQFVKIGNPDPTNVGMARVGGGDTVVYCITIDSLNLPALSLLHLDVEGCEYEVLLGAKETIKKFRPPVAVEVTRSGHEIRQLMAELDYVIVSEYGTPSNFIFVPKERLTR
jgi:FkbM family methyltransferase